MGKKKFNWLIILGILLVIVLFRTLIPGKPVLTRGIVLGLGVDKIDEGYEVTLQMVVAGNSAQPGSASSYSVISGKASTAISASIEAESRSSFAPMYSFCHIVILGEELAKSSPELVAELLYLRDIVIDETLIVAAEGTAKDVLIAKVPVAGASSLYLQQEIKSNQLERGKVSTDLKTFVCNFETPGYCNYLNWVKKQKVDSFSGSQGSESGSQGSTSGAQSSGPGGQSEYVFNCDEVLLYGEQGQTFLGDSFVATGLELAVSGAGMLLNVYTDEGFMDVLIERMYRYWKVYKDGRSRLNTYYYVKVMNQNMAESVEELSTAYIKGAVKEEIRSNIKYTYEWAKRNGIDVFNLRGKCLKKYGKKMMDVEPTLDIALTVFVSD